MNTYAEVTRAQLEAGIELTMVVGNKIDECGKAFAKLENGNIVVTIENFGKGDFGVTAFNKAFDKNMPKNGNIHSQKASDMLPYGLHPVTGFNHDNKTTIPCPSGNGNVYLYIHCGTIQFYLPV
jgi:hypothetical protein